ncbi:MAG: SpoIID/LytB domain-containing protein [Firmicutes bacterium]|nr:SpoIID/LytB domain-containing protein [Bacillota bacterium]
MISKTKNIVLAVCVILIVTLTTRAYGNEKRDFVMIGLESLINEENCFNLYSNEGYSLGSYNDDFNEIVKLDSKELSVRMDDYYEINSNNYELSDIKDSDLGYFHLKIDENYDSYEESMEIIDDLKDEDIKAYPVYKDGFQIWIGHFLTKEDANNRKEEIEDITRVDLEVTMDKENVVIENNSGETVFLYDPNEKIYFKPNNQIPVIQINNKEYRDLLAFNIVDRNLIPINFLPLNHYLYGVVPREVSASWPMEALKAQAVAARNYTLINKSKHSNSGYGLCDTHDCQVYGGYAVENEKSNKAVDDTSNKVITYNGNLISAFYHSTSGGHTENSENIWSFEVPYLKGVDDKFSKDSPNSKWELSIDKEKLEKKLLENDIKLGDISQIKILEVSDNGRVLKLLVIGTEGNKVFEKEAIRKIIGYYELKSTWYNVKTDADVYVIDGNSNKPIKKTINNTKIITVDGLNSVSRDSDRRVGNENYKKFSITDGEVDKKVSAIPTTYYFSGKGWGHGLGMSQWGAKRMAELGYSFDEILEYYYTGTKVE